MTARKPVEDMIPSELYTFIRGLTEDEMRRMLDWLAGYAPETMDRALAHVRGLS